jgi:hypothetical protein
MKLKTIGNYLLVAFLAIQLIACDNKESIDSPFNATPTERLNARQKELNDVLESSEFGWKAVYFTDNKELGGYTHLFKFKAGKVNMASDFDNDTAIYESEYNMVLGSTVSLVFTSKNRIHLLSDSNSFPVESLRGKGYKGDFQFLYYGQENGAIVFRTNRGFGELRFEKATAQDWTDLSKNINMIPNVIGAPSRPLYRFIETNDGTKLSQFNFTFNPLTRFAIVNSTEVGPSINSNIGIGYTPTGIVVDPAIVVGNQKLSNFTYDEITGNFNAIGINGVTASIKYSNKPLIVTDDYKALLSGQPAANFGYVALYMMRAKTNSPYCIDLLTEINAFTGNAQRIDRIQFAFNSPTGSRLEYTFRGGKATIFQNVSISEDPVNKALILKHVSWTTGGNTIAEPAFLRKIAAEFTNSKGLYVTKENFKILFPNNVYTFASAASNFRITTYAFQ